MVDLPVSLRHILLPSRPPQHGKALLTMHTATHNPTVHTHVIETCISCAIGGLLCFAAGMKMYSLLVLLKLDATLTPFETFFISEVECLLGIWLLSGVKPHFALGVARLFFLAAVLYLLNGMLAGQTRCACLGSLEPRLVVMLAIDCAILASLTLFVTGKIPWHETLCTALAFCTPRNAGRFVVGLLLVTLIVSCREWLLRAGVSRWITSEPLFVADIDFGPAVSQTEGVRVRTAYVQLENSGINAVRLLGIVNDCDCKVVAGVPSIVNGRSNSRIEVQMSFDEAVLSPQRVLTILTDVPSQPRVLVSLHGT